MHYFLSAGEPSGDLHASVLIDELKKKDAEATFTFLGGDLMARAAGHPPVIPYSRMAFMGFSEVLRNLKTIGENFKIAKASLKGSGADALILVDYPSFNMKLAKYAKELGIPVFYYISPKVWAWKEWRVKGLRRYVDHILSILPFEVEYFKDKNVRVTYVGNPSKEEMELKLAHAGTKADFIARHSLDPDRQLLALVPGSRRGEIRNNLPIMDAVARRNPSLQPVIAAAPGIPPEFYAQYSSFPRIEGDTFRLMHFSEAALVTSGTATLECAIAGTPQVVCYRANGSKLSYNIMKHLIKAPFVSLPNLIADREVIPEMLVHLCTVDSVDAKLKAILEGMPGREKQLEGYRIMMSRLGEGKAASGAAAIITEELNSR